MHYIYLIPEVKIGCTTNLFRRTLDYAPGTKLIVLITLIGFTNEEAELVEAEYSDNYGFPRDKIGYAQTVRNYLSGCSKGGYSLARSGRNYLMNMTSKDHSNAGIIAANSLKHNSRRIVKCDHCGTEGNLPIMKRWHFNNCSKRIST